MFLAAAELLTRFSDRIFTLLCTAFNAAKYPFLLNWTQEYRVRENGGPQSTDLSNFLPQIGRLACFKFPHGSDRWFMIAHSALMIHLNVIASLIGLSKLAALKSL